MRAINRCVAIVKVKQPYLDWANSLPDPTAGMDLASLNDDSHAYLLPEIEMMEDQVEILAVFYGEIFENELAAWCTDQKTFPKKRSLRMFEQWFDVELHSLVLDLIDDEQLKHS
jgi:hypothetical protein